ncbi:MAG TPA: Rrf2 family transcriptional regulator [Atribacteraceae bacterium]|nr:Rrf2 family transcriptional regulator [Atribacteraceae bacterium]
MKISTRLRYGLRMLIDLALNQSSVPVKLKDISRRQNISLNYLRQLIIPLETAGFIRSVRGNKGGYVLKKPPRDINIQEIAAVLEGPFSLVDCVDNPRLCHQANACPTRNLWVDVSQKIRNTLSEKTLEDLLQEGGSLN